VGYTLKPKVVCGDNAIEDNREGGLQAQLNEREGGAKVTNDQTG